MTDINCLICKKQNNNQDIVYQNDLLYVSHFIPHPDKQDNYLGYYFIESKRHFTGIHNATDEEMIAISIMLRNLSKAVMSILDIKHVYSFIIGEGVDHFHLHVVVRYKNAPKEYWCQKVDEWPQAPRGGTKEIRDLNDQIKRNLDSLDF